MTDDLTLVEKAALSLTEPGRARLARALLANLAPRDPDTLAWYGEAAKLVDAYLAEVEGAAGAAPVTEDIANRTIRPAHNVYRVAVAVVARRFAQDARARGAQRPRDSFRDRERAAGAREILALALEIGFDKVGIAAAARRLASPHEV